MVTVPEENSLIASFMSPTSKFLNYELSSHDCYDLMFDILEKIKKQDCIIDIAMFGESRCEIRKYFVNDERTKIFIYREETLKEAIYNCIVEYIEWYNKNNNKDDE